MANKKLHYNTITLLLHEVLNAIMVAPEFDAFRLVGGTALSLQLGHRKSIDIDLFTDAMHGSVDFEAIDLFLRNRYAYIDTSNIKEVGMGRSYFVGNNKNDAIKLDIYYNEPYIQEAIVVDSIRMASTDEIVAMKMDVVQRTGRKKDFWDLHELKDTYTLKQMLEWHEKRYPYVHNASVIKRNLTDFKKADEDFDPVCLRGKQWGLIKLDMIDFAGNGSYPLL